MERYDLDLEALIKRIIDKQSMEVYELCAEKALEFIKEWSTDEDGETERHFLNALSKDDQEKIIGSCVNRTWRVLVEYFALIQDNTAARFLDSVTLAYEWDKE